MKLSGLMLFAAFALVSGAASAKEVVITDTRCVGADLRHTHDSITDYQHYSETPGAKYQMRIPAYGAFPMLSMIKSQARYTSRAATGSDGIAWVVLQPTNITDAAFYPRFLLHCVSSFDSSTHFTHSCSMATRLQHFGLQNFESTLEAMANSRECGGKGTLLVYRLVLDGAMADVEAIKNKAVEPWGPILGPIIGSFFNVEHFFRDYYTNFYDGWAKNLDH